MLHVTSSDLLALPVPAGVIPAGSALMVASCCSSVVLGIMASRRGGMKVAPGWGGTMPTRERVQAFVAMVEANKFVEAIRAFYTDDATMQENLGEVRAG